MILYDLQNIIYNFTNLLILIYFIKIHTLIVLNKILIKILKFQENIFSKN